MINRRALFFQAIRGPVLLITIGSLFAIQQTGHASFGRTWPVLIIVIGLMKLLERTAGPVAAYPPPPPNGGDFPATGNYPNAANPGAGNYTGGGPVR